jgi:hypothetical protein
VGSIVIPITTTVGTRLMTSSVFRLDQIISV